MHPERQFVYTTCYGGDTSYWLAAAWLLSIEHNSVPPFSFDVAVLTDKTGEQYLQSFCDQLSYRVKILTTPSPKRHIQATWARYNISNHCDLRAYSHILYLDPDVWVNADLTPLLAALATATKSTQPLLAYRDNPNGPINVLSQTGQIYYGGLMFARHDPDNKHLNTAGFSTGVLFFRNCPEVFSLFADAQPFAKEFFRASLTKPPHFYRCDQPSINYLAITRGLVDTSPMDALVSNNPSPTDTAPLCHFCGGIGNPNKARKIATFAAHLHSKPKQWDNLSALLHDNISNS